MTIEYRINSLKDFLDVPEDKQAQCLEDFGVWLRFCRLHSPDAFGPHTTLSTDSFMWIDDDVRGVSDVSFSVNGEEIGRLSEEAKAELTLEPMTDWNGNEIADHPENEEYKALLKLSRKFGLGTSLTINIAPGVCSIHDNHGDEFRFPIERAQEVIEAWAIVEAARVL